MSLEENSPLPKPEKREFPIAFAAGGVVVLIVAAILVFVSHGTNLNGPSPASVAAAQKLPFGATEKSYASRVHFQDIQLARSTNLLNQEFTFVAGTIANDGDRPVAGLQVTIEFHDPFNQVILSDTETLIAHGAQPLPGGQKRDFQVILEHVPVEWNRQYPTIRATGLILQ
jgi:hypothetical protein